MIRFLPVLGFALLASPVPAEQTQPSTPAPSASSGASSGAVDATADKKICRREPVLGSIMPKRTCHTKSEWASIDAANSAAASDALSRRNGRMGAGSGS
ncbi:hypothetical protein [Sphingomonas aerophila]|uniref:Uncharacterized protein n=1 Tax=Sphingomonas aerophila TaxID=1344948 RepID=A0A7W9BAW4_9SPHN|nr:hypothetical protein [Sphingomonas aerophila]MBB5713639.1 hypothetical protein [Sphingomonas aerophila]